MNTSTLHTATEELAALLSEVTHGDLGRLTPGPFKDVGDLYLYLNDQNIRVAISVANGQNSHSDPNDPIDRADLGVPVGSESAGLEVGYRQTAQFMEAAFASVTATSRLCRVDGLDEDIEVAALYEMQASNTVIHTWDIAQALGFSYCPEPEVAWRSLLAMVSRRAYSLDTSRASIDASDVFGCALRLAGRTP